MKNRPYYMIGAVSQMLGLHPQTIRQYEKIGLLHPGRTDGNTRRYSDDDLERLKLIITLTKEMGINIAGVEMIIHMQEQITSLEAKLEKLSRRINDRVGENMVTAADIKRVIVKVDKG